MQCMWQVDYNTAKTILRFPRVLLKWTLSWWSVCFLAKTALAWNFLLIQFFQKAKPQGTKETPVNWSTVVLNVLYLNTSSLGCRVRCGCTAHHPDLRLTLWWTFLRGPTQKPLPVDWQALNAKLPGSSLFGTHFYIVLAKNLVGDYWKWSSL